MMMEYGPAAAVVVDWWVFPGDQPLAPSAC